MTSAHYRFYAEEIRTRASEYICQETRREMEEIAKTWDRLARDKERWEKREKISHASK